MIVIVFVFVVVIVEGPRKRFESDESGKRQIGVSGVEGERVWKRAGGSAAAGCWGHFLFLPFSSFLVWIFGWVLKFFFQSLFGWVLVDVVVVVCITFSFRLFKSGRCEDPMPEAEVKWNTVGWK